MALHCYTTNKKDGLIPISVISQKNYSEWVKQQPAAMQQWLTATGIRTTSGQTDVRLIPTTDGTIARVIACVANPDDMWAVGNLPLALPENQYVFDEATAKANPLYEIAWGLGSYQFSRYKKFDRKPATLYVRDADKKDLNHLISSIYLVRDLINTPTDDMGPTEFATAAEAVAEAYGASIHQIIGDDLLKQNYASIHTVGRASEDPPRLIDMRWGDKRSQPKITLVGKGVCFDSGGLDIKTAGNMLLMKKDMGGAAHVLGLAQMIMAANLPVSLRVLMPCVENVISGHAYKPGDIITSRSGLTIEIGNTDAEGRVILADALTEAASEKPDLLIDMATLTGAARIALGTDLPALFSNHDELAKNVIHTGMAVQDYMWQMPLYAPYRELLVSLIADINNLPSEPFAGAITAALFMQSFVPQDVPWMHIDLMAWNLRQRLGRAPGAEAMCIRALFAYIKQKYAS